MTNPTRGDTPAQLDERLLRRDQSPLPPDALLRVQSINRGKSPAGNLRYYVTTSGDVFESGHSADTNDWQTPFDQDWPAAPARTLDASTVNRLRHVLRREFAAEEAYQADQTVEGGVFLVITARITDSRLHEVIYEAIISPVAKEILALANGES